MRETHRSGAVSLWVALFLSAALHVAYFIWAAPQEIERPDTQTSTARQGLQLISLSGPSQDNQTMDTLTLYSPAVFAFPTPVGFSASLLNQTLRTPPPRLTRTLIDSGLSLQTRSRLMPENLPHTLPPPGAIFDPPPPALPQSRPPPFTVEVDGSAPFTRRVPEAWPMPSSLPNQFWSGTIAVSLDKTGRVRQALVHQHSAPPGNPASWATWAYGIRFSPGENEETGILHVQWNPSGSQEKGTP